MLLQQIFLLVLLFVASCGEEIDDYISTQPSVTLNKGVLDSFIFENTAKTKRFEPQAIRFLVDANDPRLKANRSDVLRVLHTTIEYRGAQVGGLGAVVATVVPKQNTFNKDGKRLQADVFLPWYTFYDPATAFAKDGVPYKETPAPFAEVTHVFNYQVVKSTIYSLKLPTNSDLYLLVPDESMKDLFLVNDALSIYNTSSEQSTHLKRMAYSSSAAAAFLSMFQTPNGSYFDVIHNHSVPFSISIGLTKTLYAPYLKKKSQKPPPNIFTMHNLDWDQGTYGNSFLAPAVNLMHLGIEYADAVLGVSKALTIEGLIPNLRFSYGLAPLLTKVKERNRLYGIFNGLNTNEFDPFNDSTLVLKAEGAQKAVDLRFDKDDMVESKLKVKQHLVERGIIKDASRPLFMFVGRYSLEKGLELLPKAAQVIVKNGGSFVVMGADIQSKPANDIISRLIAMMPSLKGHLYTMRGNVREEQVKFKTGNFVRAASDFVIVPSLAESAGLVPVESLHFGTIPIASNTTGLKDTLRNLEWSKDKDIGTLTGNAFVFDTGKFIEGSNKAQTDAMQLEFMAQGMEIAILDALDFYKFSRTKKDQMNTFLKKLNAEATTYDWLDPNGALESYFKMYQEVIKN